DTADLDLHPAARRQDVGKHGAAKNDQQAEEPDAAQVEPAHWRHQGSCPRVPSINSTLARGMITPSPDSNVTSSTRAFEPDCSVCGSCGSAVTRPMSPKYGSRIARTGAPI